MLDQLKQLDFADLGPAGIAIERADGRIVLTVVEVRKLPPISPRPEPFAVLLQGPAEPLLPQATYTLVHPRHGPLDLFMVPVGRDALQTRYEVIFN